MLSLSVAEQNISNHIMEFLIYKTSLTIEIYGNSCNIPM